MRELPLSLLNINWLDGYFLLKPVLFLPGRVDKELLKPCIDIAATSESVNRRRLLVLGIAPLIAVWTFDGVFSVSPSKAIVDGQQTRENEEDKGILDTVRSIFDPNEKTKSGKVLPKAYLKSAREVVRTLRESLKEDTKDIAKFRKTADAAKESIREYLSGWRGEQVVKAEVWIYFYSSCEVL